MITITLKIHFFLIGFYTIFKRLIFRTLYSESVRVYYTKFLFVFIDNPTVHDGIQHFGILNFFGRDRQDILG